MPTVSTISTLLNHLRERNKQELFDQIKSITGEVVKAKSEKKSIYGLIANVVEFSSDLFPSIKEHTIHNELRKRKKAPKGNPPSTPTDMASKEKNTEPESSTTILKRKNIGGRPIGTTKSKKHKEELA